MNNILVLLPLCLLLFFSSTLQAQDAATTPVAEKSGPTTKREKAEAETKEMVQKVLDFAQKRNYASMSRITVYAGRDPNRTMQTKINMNDPHEKLECENNLNYMHHVLGKSVIWNATNFRMVKGVSDTYYYWNVEFTNEKMKTMVYQMLFVDLAGEYLFASFDKKGKLK